MRINVVGTSGVGKSTLARRLAGRLAVPYIEMDRLYWRENWQGTTDDELFARLADTLSATESWVLDGNYNRTRPVKWRNVQTIVWVDCGFWRTLRQAISRAFSRAWTRQELWPGTGNRESFRRSFFSRESIILWTLKTWHKNRRRYLADMHDPQFAGLTFVRLRTRVETEAFIAKITHQAAGNS
ncbi:AAA family ATPase [Enterobacter sp. CC120223-11]|uniref:AAA family ATPase n=1 Tax=Enterobacter sp. CC120223-11 TaxID=1378073 RepID=UPI000BDCCA7A|nr:AAA family ATPase [Enterobacter sp. CC120223-11]SNY58836.1 Adenylate kinase and related kinases [Enterobacter sp. CC120223-11]